MQVEAAAVVGATANTDLDDFTILSSGAVARFTVVPTTPTNEDITIDFGVLENSNCWTPTPAPAKWIWRSFSASA